MEIEQLVLPLCYYSEGVLEESDDDKEATNGRKKAVFPMSAR